MCIKLCSYACPPTALLRHPKYVYIQHVQCALRFASAFTDALTSQQRRAARTHRSVPGSRVMMCTRSWYLIPCLNLNKLKAQMKRTHLKCWPVGLRACECIATCIAEQIRTRPKCAGYWIEGTNDEPICYSFVKILYFTF